MPALSPALSPAPSPALFPVCRGAGRGARGARGREGGTASVARGAGQAVGPDSREARAQVGVTVRSCHRLRRQLGRRRAGQAAERRREPHTCGGPGPWRLPVGLRSPALLGCGAQTTRSEHLCTCVRVRTASHMTRAFHVVHTPRVRHACSEGPAPVRDQPSARRAPERLQTALPPSRAAPCPLILPKPRVCVCSLSVFPECFLLRLGNPIR